MKISDVLRMAVAWYAAIKTSLVRATNDTGNLIREIALCPNNSTGSWRYSQKREREKKKLLVLTLGRYDVRTLGSYRKSSRELSTNIKGHGVKE